MEIIEELIKSGKAVVFGSHSLGVARPDSDIDIAILWKDLPEELSNLPLNSLDKYFDVYPKYESSLLRLERVDIVLLREPSDLDVVKKSVKDLQGIHKYMLEDKRFRIETYEMALRKYGWVWKYG